jgi:hypothetical protein
VKQKLKIRRNNKELIEIDNDKTPPVVMNMTDCAGLQYDWRLRLSRLNMTDFDLAKYDWRRRECGGGCLCNGENFFSINGGKYHPKISLQLFRPPKGTSLRKSASIEALWSSWLLPFGL